MAWRVGMKARCVNMTNSVAEVWMDPVPAVGEEVIVDEVWIDPMDGGLCLTIAEYPRPRAVERYGDFYRGFCASRFRPLVDRKTDISTLTAIADGSRRVQIADPLDHFASAPVDAAMERAMAEAYPGYVADYVRGR